MTNTDIVVAWVNGQDAEHAAKRETYLAAGPAQENLATKARRFSDNEEIRYALRSIFNYAPWVRKVWIVTDDQSPACIDPMMARAYNIEIVDHRVIYRDFEPCLPVFNSLAIETMLWRIPGLAEQFIYFNDDMMLVAPTKETDFFRNGKVVLRGSWSDHTDRPVSFHGENQQQAARLFGHDLKHFFSVPHVPYAMLRTAMAEAFEAFAPAFETNMAFRFRSRSQFWPIAVNAYQAMRSGRAVGFVGKSDWRHFPVKFCRTATAEELVERLAVIRDHKTKMTCINYFEAVAEKVPDALDYISQATGPRAPFEAGEPMRPGVESGMAQASA